MARTFRHRQTAAPISELNVTNLIDLGFTLLIIFMISTPLIQSEQTIPVKRLKRPSSATCFRSSSPASRARSTASR